jgi:DNA invertase Pin-like site-specific DNA recombinase
MKVALYARVSTDDKGQSPEMQLRDFNEFVSRRGWTVYKEYVDVASGSKESRPQLDRLMRDAAQRKFDVVLVWKFDRFARSVKHLISALNEFNALGIGFVSYTQNIDTTTPMGKVMFTMLAAFAEFERDTIIERVNAGIRNAKAKGVHCGRPVLVCDEKAILTRFKAHESQRSIAREMGISAATVKRVVDSHTKKKGH